jgi:hypothetical protein
MNCEGGAIEVEFKPLKKEELLDGGKEARHTINSSD